MSLLSCGQGRVASTRGSLEFGGGIGSGGKSESFFSFADGGAEGVFARSHFLVLISQPFP